MVVMTESGRQVAEAVEQIKATIDKEGPSRLFDPHDLIRTASQGRNIGAYQAAMQSLLAAGTLEQAENWTVRLSSQLA